MVQLDLQVLQGHPDQWDHRDPRVSQDLSD